MPEPLLGRLSARSFLKSWLHPTSLAMALMLVGARSEAQIVTAPPSPSKSVATKNYSVTPVPGWIRFCKQRPEECAVKSFEPATITLTPQAWEMLTRVNPSGECHDQVHDRHGALGCGGSLGLCRGRLWRL